MSNFRKLTHSFRNDMRNVIVITHNNCDIMHGDKLVIIIIYTYFSLFLSNESGLQNNCLMNVKNAYLYIIVCMNKFLTSQLD